MKVIFFKLVVLAVLGMVGGTVTSVYADGTPVEQIMGLFSAYCYEPDDGLLREALSYVPAAGGPITRQQYLTHYWAQIYETFKEAKTDDVEDLRRTIQFLEHRVGRATTQRLMVLQLAQFKDLKYKTLRAGAALLDLTEGVDFCNSLLARSPKFEKMTVNPLKAAVKDQLFPIHIRPESDRRNADAHMTMMNMPPRNWNSIRRHYIEKNAAYVKTGLMRDTIAALAALVPNDPLAPIPGADVERAMLQVFPEWNENREPPPPDYVLEKRVIGVDSAPEVLGAFVRRKMTILSKNPVVPHLPEKFFTIPILLPHPPDCDRGTRELD